MVNSTDFNKIAQLAKISVADFEKRLNKFLQTHNSDFNDYINYIFSAKGKRLRPFLIYLSAKIFGKINNRTHNAAVIVEVLHNATLIHDDIVDEATTRHNQQTLNVSEGNKKAVLTGDYLLAKALQLAVDEGEFDIIKMMIPVICDMSEGELQQLTNNSLIINEANYYEIISKKTASLIALCMKIGAITTNASREQIENIGKIGELIGYIFQIKDDILDYIGSSKTGKEIGNDIKESKITLPLICAWKNMNADEQKLFTDIWHEERNYQNINKIIETVVEHNGIIESNQQLFLLREEMYEKLEILPQNSAKYIKYLTDYIIDREN